MNNLGLAISGTCGLILLAFSLGLIFNRSFRKDVLGGSGETTIFGVITTKGAAILVLSSIFLAGMLYPIITSNEKCHAALNGIRVGLGDKARYHATSENIEILQETIKALSAELEEAELSCR